MAAAPKAYYRQYIYRLSRSWPHPSSGPAEHQRRRQIDHPNRTGSSPHRHRRYWRRQHRRRNPQRADPATASVQVGSNTLTYAISEKMGVSLEAAHQLKVLHGYRTAPNKPKYLTPSLNRYPRLSMRSTRSSATTMNGSTQRHASNKSSSWVAALIYPGLGE